MVKSKKPRRKPAKRALKRFMGSKTDMTVTPAHGDPLHDQISKKQTKATK